MKRLEAILSRGSLDAVTGVLIEHGCGEFSLFNMDGANASELANPCPSGPPADFPWIRLEAVVGDAEALPTVQAILDASHRHSGIDGTDQTEPVSSIAIWKVESSRPRPSLH